MTLEELRQTGEVERTSAGALILRGRTLDVFHWLDRQFETMAIEAGAAVFDAPASIDDGLLARAGYYESFGEGATRWPGAPEDDTQRRAPAMCYHAYGFLAGRRIDAPIRLTVAGTCHRAENASTSFTRLNEFTMREVVWFGTDEWVSQERRQWIDRLSGFAASLGLQGVMVQSTDTFFADAHRGKRMIQQLKELKYELRMSIDDREPAVAVASMNLHETFFGSRFGITTEDGKAVSSGCIACGLERWALALVAQLGLERAGSLASAPAGRA